MSSIYTNLLFMHGHITNLELARRLAEAPPSPPRSKGKREPARNVMTAIRKSLSPSKLAHGGCG
jgi:hypothetical protein